MRSMPRCYKLARFSQFRVDSLSNELVVRQSLAGKSLSKEAEDVVGNLHQATTGEDTAG
jgi:hypothetical protein